MSDSTNNNRKGPFRDWLESLYMPASGRHAAVSKTEVILRRAYLVLTVLSAIIVAAYVFWKLFFAVAPNVGNTGSGIFNNGPEIATRPPSMMETIDPETGEKVEVEVPGLSGDRKDNFYTFLLVGVSQEEGGYLTDTMMLASYDVPNQKVGIMSLPRDTYVISNGRAVLLNSVYMRSGGDTDNKGITALKNAVGKLTGVTPDYYVIVQWEALGELVDAIGGVDFEVPFNMYYNDLSQGFKIDLKKGWQTLDGNGAMGLVRWRQNSDNAGHIDYSVGYREGDVGRIKTQQAFLKATIKKCLQPSTMMGNVGKFIKIFQRNVNTDLTAGNLGYFAEKALGGLDMDGILFTTLPFVEAGDGAHLLPVGRQIVKTMNASFNPYKEDIQLYELTLADFSVVTTKAPTTSESPAPSGSPRPGSSESPRPTESDGTVLPPNATASQRPGESPAPSRHPTGSEPPETGAQPTENTPRPSVSVPPPPDEPAPPPVVTQAPPPPPPADNSDEPLLPPGA